MRLQPCGCLMEGWMWRTWISLEGTFPYSRDTWNDDTLSFVLVVSVIDFRRLFLSSGNLIPPPSLEQRDTPPLRTLYFVFGLDSKASEPNDLWRHQPDCGSKLLYERHPPKMSLLYFNKTCRKCDIFLRTKVVELNACSASSLVAMPSDLKTVQLLQRGVSLPCYVGIRLQSLIGHISLK